MTNFNEGEEAVFIVDQNQYQYQNKNQNKNQNENQNQNQNTDLMASSTDYLENNFYDIVNRNKFITKNSPAFNACLNIINSNLIKYFSNLFINLKRNSSFNKIIIYFNTIKLYSLSLK